MRSAVLAVSLLGATMAVFSTRQAEPRHHGAYSLWVEDRRDTMVVHWITRDSTPGYLQVSGGAGSKDHNTPAARVHEVRFKRPSADRVSLVFGAAKGPSQRDSARVWLKPTPRQAMVSGADSIFILGDTHGEFDRVVTLLQENGIIDQSLRWAGGRKHLVFDGDLVDRGAEVTRLLWLVYGLEREAHAAGGRVHVVLGNHETMVWMGDLRYVHANEQAIAQAYGVNYSRLLDTRESVLGKWLVNKPAILRLNNILFAHGGVAADWLAYNTRMFDDTLAKFINEELFYHWNDSTFAIKIDSAAYARRQDFFLSPNSVFWHRGYVQTDTLEAALDKVLRRFDANLHVVGHTPTTTVHQKHAGKLVVTHPRSPAAEMVLLVRKGSDYQRFRIEPKAAPTPLPSKD